MAPRGSEQPSLSGELPGLHPPFSAVTVTVTESGPPHPCMGAAGAAPGGLQLGRPRSQQPRAGPVLPPVQSLGLCPVLLQRPHERQKARARVCKRPVPALPGEGRSDDFILNWALGADSHHAQGQRCVPPAPAEVPFKVRFFRNPRIPAQRGHLPLPGLPGLVSRRLPRCWGPGREAPAGWAPKGAAPDSAAASAGEEGGTPTTPPPLPLCLHFFRGLRPAAPRFRSRPPT